MYDPLMDTRRERVNDGSSKTGLKKMNALCVYIFDVSRSMRAECNFKICM